MGVAQKTLDAALGKFVCDDGGVYKGQCAQLPKYFARNLGMNWPGRTNNGNKLVDRVVELGGYYGEGKQGYRIASCDIKDSKYGHTWVEIKINGTWTIYEQNVNRGGVASADFGVGRVYATTKTQTAGSGRLNIRYAGHPAIDAYIEKADKPAPKPQPQPQPQPQPAQGFKVGDTVVPTRLVDYNGTPLRQYDPKYTITQINGDRAVLSARGAIWAAMNTKDIRKA